MKLSAMIRKGLSQSFPQQSLILGLILVLLSTSSLAGKPLKIGDKAHDWILPNSSNQQVSFYKDSGDKPAVILFWATWCPYCAELMPELQTLIEEFDSEDVKFYALNVWEDGDPQAYMAKREYDFSLLLNADTVAKRYGVRGTPGLMVVDKNKVVRYVRTKNTSAEDAANQVRAALSDNK